MLRQLSGCRETCARELCVGTHQFGLGNLDPATGELTAAGETLYEFLSTLGMEAMGFSGNLSQIPNNSPDPANPGTNLPAASGWPEDYVNPVVIGARTWREPHGSPFARTRGQVSDGAPSRLAGHRRQQDL